MNHLCVFDRPAHFSLSSSQMCVGTSLKHADQGVWGPGTARILVSRLRRSLRCVFGECDFKARSTDSPRPTPCVDWVIRRDVSNALRNAKPDNNKRLSVNLLLGVSEGENREELAIAVRFERWLDCFSQLLYRRSPSAFNMQIVGMQSSDAFI